MSEELATYFMDQEGNELGSSDQLLNIPIYKGMKVTITGKNNDFEVIDWNYHHGHPDEKAGLRIVLKSKNINDTIGVS